jgi:diguanylate cyclase (GGDEF)-like protein
MTAESSESLRKMAEQVADYRSRADTSEKLSYVDPLTGLANRRRFEEQLEIKVKAGRVFSLIMIDMNNFKHVNDRHGHLAGDELLKQFAEELSSQFRLADLVTRWGGDEFAVIVNSNQNDAMARLNGLRRAALGQYKVTVGHKTISVTVDAAIGVVEWNRTESGAELLARADQSMYARKQSERSDRANAPDTHSVSVHG